MFSNNSLIGKNIPYRAKTFTGLVRVRFDIRIALIYTLDLQTDS